MKAADSTTLSRLQAVLLRGHLQMLAQGMKNSQFSMKDILAKATALTGVEYPTNRESCEKAREDLYNKILNPSVEVKR